jgi:AAHS family 4-hydroxybenzoate transporter-like MFS transporter
MSQANGKAVDIGQTLDNGAWSSFQKFAVLLAALAIILDGFDSQLIGFAIPALIKEWGIPRAAFSGVVAMGLIGMALGSLIAGPLGDRIGRRRAVIGSVFVFGLATFLIGFSPNLIVLGALRFLAGLGIGGALPTATTLAAEFTPARRRTLAVTATIVCVPLGGMLAGIYAGHIIPSFGWRALFWIGGALPAVFGLLLVALLPESPRFLAHRPDRWADLRNLLGRMGHATPEGATFTDNQEKEEKRASFAALFETGRGLNSLILWFTFFLTLLAVYSTFSWLPAMLTAERPDLKVAADGLTASNLGGVFGALLCALAINRVGSRISLVVCGLGAAASAFYLMANPGIGAGGLIIVLAINGFFLNAVQSTLYAVSAYTYPTTIRATGTAAALGFGRLGAILSAFVGTAVIAAGGAQGYYGLLGGAMLGSAVMLLLLRKHIPAGARPIAS